MSQDPRQLLQEIREALDIYPREQLQEMLAYVFKEYVALGTPTVTAALPALDARTELSGLSFAELITWLQLHLSVPELGLFEVQAGRVRVRIGGRTIELTTAPSPSDVAAPAARAASGERAASAAGASSAARAEALGAQSARPASGGAPPAGQAEALGAASTRPATAPAGPTAGGPVGGSTPPPTDGEPEDRAAEATRFSWLEVD